MSDHPESRNGFVNPSVHFEPTDLGARPVLIFMAALIAAIAVTAGAIWWMMHAFVGPSAPSKAIAFDRHAPWSSDPGETSDTSPAENSRLATPPALEEIDQNTPAVEGGRLHTRRIDRQIKEEEDRLNSYGWVDENKGIVHIPIKNAMERLSRDPGGVP